MHLYLQFRNFFELFFKNYVQNTQDQKFLIFLAITTNLHDFTPIQIKKTYEMVHTNFSTRLTQCLHLTLEMQFKYFLENFAGKNQGLSQIIMYILSSEDLCHIAFSRKRALQLISSGYAPNPCDAHSVLKLRIPFGNYMG